MARKLIQSIVFHITRHLRSAVVLLESASRLGIVCEQPEQKNKEKKPKESRKNVPRKPEPSRSEISNKFSALIEKPSTLETIGEEDGTTISNFQKTTELKPRMKKPKKIKTRKAQRDSVQDSPYSPFILFLLGLYAMLLHNFHFVVGKVWKLREVPRSESNKPKPKPVELIDEQEVPSKPNADKETSKNENNADSESHEAEKKVKIDTAAPIESTRRNSSVDSEPSINENEQEIEKSLPKKKKNRSKRSSKENKIIETNNNKTSLQSILESILENSCTSVPDAIEEFAQPAPLKMPPGSFLAYVGVFERLSRHMNDSIKLSYRIWRLNGTFFITHIGEDHGKQSHDILYATQREDYAFNDYNIRSKRGGVDPMYKLVHTTIDCGAAKKFIGGEREDDFLQSHRARRLMDVFAVSEIDTYEGGHAIELKNPSRIKAEEGKEGFRFFNYAGVKMALGDVDFLRIEYPEKWRGNTLISPQESYTYSFEEVCLKTVQWYNNKGKHRTYDGLHGNSVNGCLNTLAKLLRSIESALPQDGHYLDVTKNINEKITWGSPRNIEPRARLNPFLVALSAVVRRKCEENPHHRARF